MLTEGKSPAAEKYFQFIKSTEAQGIFKKHGFLPY